MEDAHKKYFDYNFNESKMNTIEIADRWFNAIYDGIKPIEGKKYSQRWRHLKTGDVITFRNSDNPETGIFTKKIVSIQLYQNLDDYLNGEGLQNVLPGITTIEEGKLEYYKFWNNDEEIKRDGGIMAIRLS